MNQNTHAFFQLCQIVERFFNCDENDWHGAGLFKRPCARLLRDQGSWTGVVCTQTTWAFAENILRYTHVVNTVTDFEHCSRAIRTWWARIPRIQSHNIQHITEIQTNCSDSQLDIAWSNCSPMTLRD